MKKKTSILIGAIVAVATLLGAVSVTTAYAQDGAPSAGLPGDGRGHGGGRGLGQVELEAAAEVLGMTTDELSTALKDGKTLADLATDAGRGHSGCAGCGQRRPCSGNARSH